MSTLTVRLSDEKHARLRQLAQAKGMSMNHLMDELATIALVGHDAEVRFQLRAKQGSAKRGLALLDRLDRQFKE